jgi:hypothetical protein
MNIDPSEAFRAVVVLVGLMTTTIVSSYCVCVAIKSVYHLCCKIYWYANGTQQPKTVYPVTFNEREMKVFSQLMSFIEVQEKMMDSDAIIISPLKQVILDINHKHYTQNFVPTVGQIRLEKAEWDAFVSKLKSICES